MCSLVNIKVTVRHQLSLYLKWKAILLSFTGVMCWINTSWWRPSNLSVLYSNRVNRYFGLVDKFVLLTHRLAESVFFYSFSEEHWCAGGCHCKHKRKLLGGLWECAPKVIFNKLWQLFWLEEHNVGRSFLNLDSRKNESNQPVKVAANV